MNASETPANALRLNPEVQGFLSQYLARVREEPGNFSGDESLQGALEALLAQLKKKKALRQSKALALLMLYFGTTLDSQALVILERGHFVPARGGGLAILQSTSLEDGSDRPRVWTETWQSTANWIQDGQGSGALAAPNFAQGAERRRQASPESRRIWLDEESSQAIHHLLDLLPEGESLLFTAPSGEALAREAVFDLVDDLRESVEEAMGLGHTFFPIYSVNDYEVIPTPLRLNADPRFSGKGVTIAFIDSGFYPHADLMEPENRVLAYCNIAQPEVDDFDSTHVSSWHGMQTSLSAAGNGYLSRGLYRGVAHEANVVLLKVTGPKGIETEHILEAFRWVARNQEAYNIRVVNVSLGGGDVLRSHESELDQAAEALVQMGVTVVVAAGNDGHSPDPRIRPPASAPSVITVGGVNDNNRLNFHDYQMYWSSYGFTLDGVLKPDLIAPGIWVVAPLLPGTPIHDEAHLLHEIAEAEDGQLTDLLRSGRGEGHWPADILKRSPDAIRAEAEARRRAKKVVPPHYQHVDGTSFAAPIVCSVVAQMIEANPELTPQRIKEILIGTTDRLFQVPVEQQGHGVIHPRKAVKEAINDLYREGHVRRPSPCVEGRKVTFYYYSDDPKLRSVSVSGSFNGWDPKAEPLRRTGEPHLWSTTRVFQAPGAHKYKFVLNGREWVHDPENGNREPDGYGGYNARLMLLV